MDHLLWCLFSVVISVCISFIGRLLVNKLTTHHSARLHYNEFAANFVCAVVVMEFVVISYVQHSQLFYFSALYLFLFLKNLFFVVNELYANPLSFLNLFYSKNRTREFSFFEVGSIVSIQLVSSVLGQYFVKYLWLHEDAVHMNAYEESCMSNLSHNHVWYECFLIEAFGVFICAVIDYVTPDKLKWYVRPLATVTVIYNLSYVTGTWMNPALATAFTFRCEGHRSDWEHVFVYWVAPFFGLFLAWEITHLASRFFSKGTSTDSKTNVGKKTN